jgi:hypothetical protein
LAAIEAAAKRADARARPATYGRSIHWPAGMTGRRRWSIVATQHDSDNPGDNADGVPKVFRIEKELSMMPAMPMPMSMMTMGGMPMMACMAETK